MMLVSEYIIRYLKQNKIELIFGVGGANIEDLYDAIFYHGEGIQGVIAKHEFSAVTMADGYSRVGRKLGVVFATSGGGAFNLIPGLAEAVTSHVPLLVIVGQVPQHTEGKGGFQDSSGLAGSISAENIFNPVSKYCCRIIDPKQIPQTLQDAIQIAQETPYGPSVLLIPKNIQSSTLDSSVLSKSLTPHPRSLFTSKKLDHDNEQIENAVELLSDPLSRIIILCGEAVIRFDVQHLLKELASRLNAMVAVTSTGKGAYDNHCSRFTGIVGVMGHPSATEALKQANTCILIGTRLSVMSRFGLETILNEKNIIYINHQPSFLEYKDGHSIRVELLGSITAILNKLLTYIIKRGRQFKDPPASSQPLIEFLTTTSHNSRKACPSFEEFMCILDKEIEPTANVVVDAGNTGAAATHFLKTPSKGTFTIALGMGGMGYSFGAGIGACLSNLQKTYVIAGDGAFFMHGSEIHTAVELELPIIFIIINNNAHAMCTTREAVYYNAPYSYNQFKKTNIGGGISAMFSSVRVFSVQNAIDFKKALAQLNDHLAPALICIEIDASAVPPFKPFLDKMAISSH
jgi:acetolactate synthase I/II/III large subunit